MNNHVHFVLQYGDRVTTLTVPKGGNPKLGMTGWVVVAGPFLSYKKAKRIENETIKKLRPA